MAQRVPQQAVRLPPRIAQGCYAERSIVVVKVCKVRRIQGCRIQSSVNTTTPQLPSSTSSNAVIELLPSASEGCIWCYFSPPTAGRVRLSYPAGIKWQ